MKTIINKFLILTLVFATSLLNNCKEKESEGDSGFTLLPRNSYFVDTYNGIEVYRSNETRKPLNGYYVIGDKFTKWEEFDVENGVLNGDYIIFHQSGEKFSHSKYVKGKLHGEEKVYFPSGKLKRTVTYKNGARVGKTISYFESGQIKNESTLKDEEAIESTTYDIVGNIESQMFIKDGRRITQRIRNGKVYLEEISSTYDDFEAMKFYNEDGSVKAFFRMLDEGDNSYLIELNENGDEIKRIDVKKNPQEIFKYRELLGNF